VKNNAQGGVAQVGTAADCEGDRRNRPIADIVLYGTVQKSRRARWRSRNDRAPALKDGWHTASAMGMAHTRGRAPLGKSRHFVQSRGL